MKIQNSSPLRVQFYVAFVSGSILAFQFATKWLYLKNEKSNYGDLKYILDCSREINLSRFFSHGECPEYMYGVTWLHFAHYTGLYKIPPSVLMIAILLIYSIFLGNSIRFSNTNIIFKIAILVIFLLFTPPVSLLFQRGNLDGLILEMVIFSAIFLCLQKYRASIILLLLTSLFKFYTYPLLIFILIWAALTKKITKIASISVMLLATYITFNDLLLIPRFPWDARNMFGAPIFLEYIDFAFFGPHTHANKFLAILLGLLAFIVILLSLRKLGISLAHPEFSIDSTNQRYFFVYLFLLGSFIPMYFVGLSIDYRLTFIIIPQVMYCLLCVDRYRYCVSNLILLALTSFLSFNTYLLQPVGDFALCILVGIHIDFVVTNRKKIMKEVFLRY